MARRSSSVLVAAVLMAAVVGFSVHLGESRMLLSFDWAPGLLGILLLCGAQEPVHPSDDTGISVDRQWLLTARPVVEQPQLRGQALPFTGHRIVSRVRHMQAPVEAALLGAAVAVEVSESWVPVLPEICSLTSPGRAPGCSGRQLRLRSAPARMGPGLGMAWAISGLRFGTASEHEASRNSRGRLHH